MAFWCVSCSTRFSPPTDLGRPSSSIVATPCTPRALGSLSSPAYCTWPLLVCGLIPPTSFRTWFGTHVTDTAMGIVLVYYQIAKPSCTIWSSATAINVGVPYSISVSLDVLLTLMIAVRLVLLSRDIRSAMGVPFRLSGTYKAVITILSESSALYAITFLLWIGTWAAESPAEYFFFPVLAQTQVRGLPTAPLTKHNLGTLLSNHGDGTGHRSVPHRSASRPPESIDGRPRLRGHLFNSFEPRGIDGHRWPSCGFDQYG